MISGRPKYFLSAIISVAMWVFFAIPLRNLKAFPAEQILHFRIVLSLIVTWLIISIGRTSKVKEDLRYFRSETARNKRRIVGLILLSGILITGNWYSFIYAINNVSIKSAAFAYMVCPLITAIGGFFILKESVTPYKIAGLALALVSILILAKGSIVEVLWSVFIAALYAFYLIVQRLIVKLDKLTTLGLQLVIAAILMFPLFLYHHYTIPAVPYFWINLMVIAVVFTIIPLFLSLYALIGMPSSTMGIIIYINPIVAFTLAFFYFDEQVSVQQLAAYALLFVAVAVFNWNSVRELFVKLRPSPIH